MKNMIKKFITIILVFQLLVLNSVPVVWAQEVTGETTPASNAASATPEASAQSTTTTQSPTPADAPVTDPAPSTDSTASDPQTEQASADTTAPVAAVSTESTDRDAYKAEQERIARIAWEKANPQLAALAHQSGKLGDTAVATGDANSNGAVITTGNNNLASSTGDGPSASVINSGNGSSSSNNGSAAILNDNDTNQNNSANVLSGLKGDSTTGDNSSSFNVGNSDLNTGDANTTGTIINALNTNVSGVMVSEFNIVDDHVGDIVLDFAANCISGCGSLGGVTAVNDGNGAFSQNDANAEIVNNNTTQQNNNGNVGNGLVLSADSGNNTANFNTGGNSNITTGDANVAANALTFLNNNIAGNVIYSVVNIFGDLVGDIIFPESQFNCCSGSSTNVANNGNGALSDNTANASLSNNNATFQINDGTINNNLVFDAQTGDNSTSYNTGGNSTVSTGQANVDANVLNILNNNITGGNMWLVLINDAGNWIGKIMGAVGGASYAGSEGLQFNIGNLGNGAGSTNNAGTSVTNNNTTTQNNNGTVNNTLNLSANTGGNSSSFNTGGDSNIQTGDAQIIANLVNFVNNNISGGGKLFVTIVNVFGSWAGDFVGPGQTKSTKNSEQKTENSNPSSPSNSSNSSNNASSSSSTSNSSNTARTGALNILSSFNNSNNSNSSHSSNPSTTSHPSGGIGSDLLASTDVKVAGATAAKGALQKEKKININLAWLVLLIPIALLVIVVRRVVIRRVR